MKNKNYIFIVNFNLFLLFKRFSIPNAVQLTEITCKDVSDHDH